METEVKTVEAGVEAAVAPQAVSASDIEVDLSAKLLETEAQLAKVKEEKENYKKGLLKLKGKLPDQEEETPLSQTMEELVEQKVNERFLSTKEAQLQSERDEALKAILKENNELKLAFKSKNASSMVMGSASTAETRNVPIDTFFSAEQIANLQKRGLDPEKVKQNMLKTKNSPGIIR